MTLYFKNLQPHDKFILDLREDDDSYLPTTRTIFVKLEEPILLTRPYRDFNPDAKKSEKITLPHQAREMTSGALAYFDDNTDVLKLI